MKKLIALIVTLSMMLGMCTTVFAATTPEVAENSAITINPDGSFTLDGTKVVLDPEKEENIADNNQTTIVVVEGADAGISTSSIQYINQDSNTSFTFIPKDDTAYKARETDVLLTAYIGGDAITRTTAGYITYKAEAVAPTMYTVTFKNGEETLATAQYAEGTTGVTYSGNAPTKAEDENYTYAFSHWYYVGENDAEIRVDDLTELTVNADITLFAAFTATEKTPVTPPTPDQPGDEFTLTFLNADGTPFATTTTVNGAVQLPATDPTKAKTGATGDKLDWAFVGWYTDADLTVTLGATVNANTTVYPKFVQNYIVGDINADGNINNTDLTLATQLRYGTMTTTNIEKFKAGLLIECNYYTFNGKNIQLKNGDVNGDNNVNNTDLTLLTQMRYSTITETNKAKFGLGQKATIK